MTWTVYIHDHGDLACTVEELIAYLMLDDKDMPASYGRGQGFT
jgi:hypothetical protein